MSNPKSNIIVITLDWNRSQFPNKNIEHMLGEDDLLILFGVYLMLGLTIDPCIFHSSYKDCAMPYHACLMNINIRSHSETLF